MVRGAWCTALNGRRKEKKKMSAVKAAAGELLISLLLD